MKQWRCTVCGYVHDGDDPPEMCPICGAPGSDFELFEEAPAPKIEAVTVQEWQCLNCNYVHYDDSPPDFCPVCGAPADRFDPVKPKESGSSGSAETNKVVIIGSGIAGVSAAEAIRKTSPDSQVILISLEGCLPYYRLNLTRYLAGEIDRTGLPIHDEGWYKKQGIDLRLDAEISTILPDEMKIICRKCGDLTYDKLILAMGSHPFVPPIDGSKQEGVVALRTRQDADLILAETAAGKSTVVIGGGILGLEIAGALANRGAPLTILESHEYLMPRQLNRKAAEFLEKHLNSIGCSLVKQARTQSISREGDTLSVNLEGGETVQAELVILATGVRPNTFLARKAKLEVNRGIVVDNHLRTSDEHIYAAGDVAEHNGVLYGSWSVSQYQGTIAGLNAIGQRNSFGGMPRANSVKVLGLDLFSIGQFVPVDGSYMEKDLEADGNYYHLVFQDGKLVGAILFGDAEKSTRIKKAIEEKKDFSHLLHENAGVKEILGKI